MIIIISGGLAFEQDRARKIRAVDNLLCAHGDGRHVLWMPIELVEFLQTVEDLSYYSKKVLFELKEFVIEARMIEMKFEFHAVVNFADAFGVSFSGRELRIGYAQAARHEFLSSPDFLAENILDAAAFMSGAMVYLVRNDLGAFKVSFDIYPGGGSTTFDAFNYLVSQRRLFLCIVDSDLKHPRGSLGSTARRFNSIPRGLNNGFQLEVVDCHEIENILPVEIVKKISGVEDLGLVFDNELFSVFRKYSDHKSGLRVEEAIALDRKHNSRYWGEFDVYSDDTLVCASFGDNLLQKFVDHINIMSAHKISELICDEADYEWLRLSKIVASWGVGTKRAIV